MGTGCRSRAEFDLYGRGSEHRARLNRGDSYGYALAHITSEPLLFRGNDFMHTDIESALR